MDRENWKVLLAAFFQLSKASQAEEEIFFFLNVKPMSALFWEFLVTALVP